MGRYVSSTPETTAYYGIRDVLPTYGTGGFRYYGTSGTFVVPPGVTQVRVTALGGGGGGANGLFYCSGCSVTSTGGGGGAGYVVATTPVTPGSVCTVTIGAAGSHFGYIACCNGNNACFCSGGAGGTSQFGTAICATGGGGGVADGSANPLGGCAGCYAVSSGTIVVGRCGNKGCNGCCSSQNQTGHPCYGGSSGSPIGGGGTGPWPGTGGADVYNCKSFAGDTLGESEIAAKFLNVVRWPGETILSTVRTQPIVAGVPAGFPSVYPGCNGGIGCYVAGTYGAAAIYSCNASSACCTCPDGQNYYSCLSACCWGAAGCGGGGSSGRPYSRVSAGGYSPCYFGCPMVGGCPGNGFLVVEY